MAHTKNGEAWFADLGATDCEHMFFREEWFKNMQLYSGSECTVRVGDGNLLNVKGKCDIDVKVQSVDGTSKRHTVGGVLYVPSRDPE